MKTVRTDLIEKRAGRTGDGTRVAKECLELEHHHENSVWGWEDKDMRKEDRDLAQIINKSD